MIVVDSNIWMDHLRRADPLLSEILGERRQRVHPFVIGEIALGSLRDRRGIIDLLQKMPRARMARHEEVMWLIDDEGLHDLGIGYVDAHLIASAKLMPGSRIWTRDKRLAGACVRLGLSFQAVH